MYFKLGIAGGGGGGGGKPSDMTFIIANYRELILY